MSLCRNWDQDQPRRFQGILAFQKLAPMVHRQALEFAHDARAERRLRNALDRRLDGPKGADSHRVHRVDG